MIDNTKAFVRITTSETMIVSSEGDRILLSAPTSLIANYIANQGFRKERSVSRIKIDMPDSVRWIGNSSYILERPPQKLVLRDTKNNVEYPYVTPWMVYVVTKPITGLTSSSRIFAFARPGPIQTLTDPLYQSCVPVFFRFSPDETESHFGDNMSSFIPLNSLEQRRNNSFNRPLNYIEEYFQVMSDSFSLENMQAQSHSMHKDILEFYSDEEGKLNSSAYLRDYSNLSVKDVCLLKRKIAFDSISDLISVLSIHEEKISERDFLSNYNRAVTSNVVDMFINMMSMVSEAYERPLSGSMHDYYGYQGMSPDDCEHDNGHDDGSCDMCGLDISDYIENYEEESPF